MSTVESLFNPFQSQNLDLKNRIVMAPMTRSMSPGGIPGDDVAAYYRRRAEGGVGLIITEGTAPNHPAAINDENVPLFYGEALNGWAEIVRQVHDAGAKIMPQLWHVGGLRKPGQGHNPDAASVFPSGLHHSGKKIGEPMTESQIGDLIGAYAAAAGDAKRLGFDGVEVHGAHGYLIDQFFWETTNQRTDKYGGSVGDRASFAGDVIKAIRAAVGRDYPILLRISQWKQQEYSARLAPTPDLLETFLGPLADAGVDIFHCSTRRYWEPEFDGSDMNLAGWTKKITGRPTVTVGSVGLSQEFVESFASNQEIGPASIDRLLAKLDEGEFDLVAVGRMLIAEPNWPKKVRAGDWDSIRSYSRNALGNLV